MADRGHFLGIYVNTLGCQKVAHVWHTLLSLLHFLSVQREIFLLKSFKKLLQVFIVRFHGFCIGFPKPDDDEIVCDHLHSRQSR